MVASSRCALAASLRMACFALAAAGADACLSFGSGQLGMGRLTLTKASVALETTKLLEHLQKGWSEFHSCLCFLLTV